MAKIKHKDLTRGVKLTVDHVYDTINNAVTEINNSNIEQNQLNTPYGTFRVNLPIPFIDSSFFSFPDDSGSRPFGIPFVLYPPQDRMQVEEGVPYSYQIDKNTLEIILTEIQISFSQRGEGVCIPDSHYNKTIPAPFSADAGKLNFRDVVDAYDLSMAVVEKQQTIFNPDVISPEREVFSVEIPGDAFSGKSFRFNPYVVKDINKAINPYKTYVFLLYCNGLYNRDNVSFFESYVLPGIQVSLKFKSPLIQRDVDNRPNSEVVNIPTKHDGNKDNPSLYIDTPLANNAIRAQGSDGVSTSLYTVDKVFTDKLKGGYTEFSESPPNQEIGDDSCYEVMTLPLFGGSLHGGILYEDAYLQAYWSGGEYRQAGVVTPQILNDRRVWPIKFPFVVHHIVLAWNWSMFTANVLGVDYVANEVPDHIQVDVNIGIGRGLQADDMGYEEIAKHTMQFPAIRVPNNNWEQRLLDKIKIHNTSFELGFDWELHNIPLDFSVYIGNGVFPQGSPHYIGKARTPTQPRSGFSAILGQEQFIEARVRIKKTIEDPLVLNPQGILAGYGGHFLYLLGKKHLVG